MLLSLANKQMDGKYLKNKMNIDCNSWGESGRKADRQRILLECNFRNEKKNSRKKST
jgi:hypothetical protein